MPPKSKTQKKDNRMRTRIKNSLPLNFLLLSGALLGFLTLLAGAAGAADFERRVLPNGLVLLYAERRNIPVVTAVLIVKASPLDEPAEKAGLADLTASLLTEGTGGRTSSQISSEIEFIGASLGVSIGGDYTSVSLSVLKKDMEKGFDIFSDIVINPAFPEAELNRVRTLMIDGLSKSEQDPSFVADKAFKEAVYGSFPYGRLVQGSAGTLNRISREDVVNFHSGYYRPSNCILAVVGDISPAELQSLVDKYFGKWRAKTEKALPPRLRQPEKVAKKTLLIDRDIAQANIIWGHLGASRDNPDIYALQVMNYILGGGGFSSRLMDVIRARRGLVYGVRSSFDGSLYKGVFEVSARTKNKTAREVIAAIEEQVKRMRETPEKGLQAPVSEKELAGAKANITGSFPRQLDTMGNFASFICQIEFYGLGADFIHKYPEYINAVTIDDVSRVAKKYLDPASPVLVVVARISETGLGPAK